MSVIRRLLGLKDTACDNGPEQIIRAAETEQELTEARQEFRQSLQRVQSGAKIFQTTAGAMRVINNARGETC
jgi:hypothetical protein